VIAAAASAAGSISCTPTRPVPIILSHGTADVTVSYARGAAAAVAWSKQNGCQHPPAIGALGCHAAEGCPGAGVTLCTHRGGHEYDDTFTSEATAFFAALPKPPPAGAGNREFR